MLNKVFSVGIFLGFLVTMSIGLATASDTCTLQSCDGDVVANGLSTTSNCGLCANCLGGGRALTGRGSVFYHQGSGCSATIDLMICEGFMSDQAEVATECTYCHEETVDDGPTIFNSITCTAPDDGYWAYFIQANEITGLSSTCGCGSSPCSCCADGDCDGDCDAEAFDLACLIYVSN